MCVVQLVQSDNHQCKSSKELLGIDIINRIATALLARYSWKRIIAALSGANYYYQSRGVRRDQEEKEKDFKGNSLAADRHRLSFAPG